MFYRKRLAIRLIYQLSISHDIEQSLISKFTVNCLFFLFFVFKFGIEESLWF